MSRLFHICTLMNNPTQYGNMKSSFLAAGFDEERCRYTVLDNSNCNTHEPYSAINLALKETSEEYLIFCHQDILIDRGDDIEHLLQQFDNLSQQYPDWAIVGNAGGTDTLRLARKITDPHGEGASGHLPRRVQSLDENFLVIKTGALLRCSPELNGFHLYGTDLCLDAITKGFTCHVVDFHLTHLSAGDANNQSFKDALAALQRVWNNHFRFCYVKTCCGALFLSKYALLRRYFGSPKMVDWVVDHSKIYSLLCLATRTLQGKKM
jgi:hypothetical protein